MRMLPVCLMALNTALFFFGAIQHAGVPIGALREPRIIPAAVVETLCGFALAWGAIALFGHRPTAWRAAVIANAVAAGGVVLGMVALAVGAGPRTITNDLYHRLMLALISASLLSLFLTRSRSTRSSTEEP
jgi:hypothetical protein